MQNDNIKVSVRSFQRKLDSFKTKIAFQQMLAQSLVAEFESLISEFESLKQLFGVSSLKFESTSPDFGATSIEFESTSENIDATSFDFESSSEKFDATSYKFESTSSGIESTSRNFGATFSESESSSSIRELASLIRRSAKESLNIYFSQFNISNHERKSREVAQVKLGSFFISRAICAPM